MTNETTTTVEQSATVATEKACNSFRAFEYNPGPVDCAYSVQVSPAGGKTGAQPSHAVLELVKQGYNEDGTPGDSSIVGVLKDADDFDRTFLIAWTSIAVETKSNRATNRVDTAIKAAWGTKLRSGAGLPEAAKRPIEVAELMERARSMMVQYNPGVTMEEVSAMAKGISSVLAPWINDDGTYRPEGEPEAVEESKKSTKSKKPTS